MIKLRLHGTPDELKQLSEYLRTLPRLRVLNESEPYADRGKSTYERVYIDVEFKESSAELLERLKGGEQ